MVYNERGYTVTLKEMREARGVKQIAIAEHLGITRQTYSSYEDNPRSMTVEQALAVCAFLHCDVSDIFLPNEVN